MRTIGLLLFDLDGTLIDSQQHIVNSVNYTLHKLGLPEKSSSGIVPYIGAGINDLLLGSLGRNQTGRLAESLPIFKKYYRDNFATETKLHRHVLAILEYFKNTKKFIVTNTEQEIARASVEILGIANYFETIIGGDDENCLKPTACPIEKALDLFLAEPEKALMVGDMAVDILAGQKAGVLTCGVTYGIGRKADIEKAHPDFLINDILELKKILN